MFLKSSSSFLPSNQSCRTFWFDFENHVLYYLCFFFSLPDVIFVDFDSFKINNKIRNTSTCRNQNRMFEYNLPSTMTKRGIYRLLKALKKKNTHKKCVLSLSTNSHFPCDFEWCSTVFPLNIYCYCMLNEIKCFAFRRCTYHKFLTIIIEFNRWENTVRSCSHSPNRIYCGCGSESIFGIVQHKW